jgi:hypothetical protein
MFDEQNKLLRFDGSNKDIACEIASFRLYIKGMFPESVKALIIAKAICERYLPDRTSLEIVDTLTEPERAMADGITDIPTLVKVSPIPVIRISNEIENPEQVLDAFGLRGCSSGASIPT